MSDNPYWVHFIIISISSRDSAIVLVTVRHPTTFVWLRPNKLTHCMHTLNPCVRCQGLKVFVIYAKGVFGNLLFAYITSPLCVCVCGRGRCYFRSDCKRLLAVCTARAPSKTDIKKSKTFPKGLKSGCAHISYD